MNFRWINSLIKNLKRKGGLMEDIEKKQEQEKEEEFYSKKDFDSYREKLEKEFLAKEEAMKKELEDEAKKSSMSELEIARMELEEIKKKYQEKENECLISKQREEVLNLLEEAALDKDAVELVYVPLDIESTKEKISILKEYMEKLKKNFLQDYIDTPLPQTSGKAEYDAFIDGFDSNQL